VFALHRLNVQYQKLQETVLRLQKKDRDMFQRCIAAQLSKDFARAQLYAAECSEIRKMAKIVIGSEIALERAIIRLQTVEQLGEILVQLMPVVSVIEETKDKIEGVIPEVASELGMVHSMLDDTVRETGTIQLRDSDIVLQDAEAQKIFEESSAYAEQKIREQFPELPSTEQSRDTVLESEGADTVVDPPNPMTPLREPVDKKDDLAQTLTDSIQHLSSRVYEYIVDHVKHDGKLNVNDCARFLGVERDDVMRAVETLREEKRIVIR